MQREHVALHVRHLLGTLLTFTEGVAVFVACIFPLVCTVQLLAGKELDGRRLSSLPIGIALLLAASAFRRDPRRLRYLAGPCLLFVYTSMLAVVCFAILLKGGFNLIFLIAMLVAALAAVLLVRWIEQIPDDPETFLGARRPTRTAD
jgi:peptidoglycan/LPS O-acetylase OafA/YrhL